MGGSWELIWVQYIIQWYTMGIQCWIVLGSFLANDIWVCLKLGYTPKIAILIGKIMINRGTHGAICSDKPTWESNSIRSMVLISLPIYKTGSLFAGKCWKTILEVLVLSSNPSDLAMRFEVCTPMFFHREFKPYSWPHPVEKNSRHRFWGCMLT